MNSNVQIIESVYTAKQDSQAADSFIRQYMNFIKAETAKFMKRIPIEGQDDELSIAMLAFHESILAYDRTRGSFITFAKKAIHNRLIDYTRKEQRHRNLSSLNTKLTDDSEDEALNLLESPDDTTADAMIIRTATQKEIQEFARQLDSFDISLADVADACPKQERTLRSCHVILNYARKHSEILDTVLDTQKLPIRQLEEATGVNKKIMERHRKYLIAILLAYTNGYEIIRGHLCQVVPVKGGDNR